VTTPLLRFIALILAICLAVPLLTSAAPAEAKYSRGLLWKIEAKGVAPSYLFGTMHSDDDRVLSLPSPVSKAFAGARAYAAELVEDQTSARKFYSAMVTREPHLREQVGDDTYAKVDELLRDYGIPREARPRFKPWAAILTLTQPRGASGLILDRVLIVEAGKRNKPIYPLETIDEQITAFVGIPPETQTALLRRVADDYQDIQDAVRPLVEAYLARNLTAMWKLNAESMGNDELIRPHNDIFLQRVLYERSEHMTQRLAPLLEKGGVFAAFGALHLYGERGVLQLLERQGFRPKRVY
jgi:uncharacterized protein